MEQEDRTMKSKQNEERRARSIPGMPMLILLLLLLLASVAGFVSAFYLESTAGVVTVVLLGILYICVLFPILCCGLKILKPNEAYVFTLFGKYYGSLCEEGFYFVNPFVSATNPAASLPSLSEVIAESSGKNKNHNAMPKLSKKISLKTMTLNNDKQKINDEMGNPIEIGIVVIWRVVNTAKAVFNVDNYMEFLSMQCDSALRNIVRLYPYDSVNNTDECTLRGSSQEVADKIKHEIQDKVDEAGLEILEARITHLAYAPEIAAAMLQRQQASAVIDARKMIVDGAVGMVEMALSRLSETDLVDLDEERKAAMVSNLLVVLCGNKDAQPIVNSGSIY